jgi:hypothetical protein
MRLEIVHPIESARGMFATGMQKWELHRRKVIVGNLARESGVSQVDFEEQAGAHLSYSKKKNRLSLADSKGNTLLVYGSYGWRRYEAKLRNAIMEKSTSPLIEIQPLDPFELAQTLRMYVSNE